MMLVREIHGEGGSLPNLAMYCDFAARVFHDALDHVQAQAGTFDVGVQALEHSEELGFTG